MKFNSPFIEFITNCDLITSSRGHGNWIRRSSRNSYIDLYTFSGHGNLIRRSSIFFPFLFFFSKQSDMVIAATIVSPATLQMHFRYPVQISREKENTAVYPKRTKILPNETKKHPAATSFNQISSLYLSLNTTHRKWFHSVQSIANQIIVNHIPNRSGQTATTNAKSIGIHYTQPNFTTLRIGLTTVIKNKIDAHAKSAHAERFHTAAYIAEQPLVQNNEFTRKGKRLIKKTKRNRVSHWYAKTPCTGRSAIHCNVARRNRTHIFQ